MFCAGPTTIRAVTADLAREAMLRRLAALASPGGGRTTSPPAVGPSWRQAGDAGNAAADALRPGGDARNAAADAWRPVDDDLAVLVYDSSLDPELLASVRSSSTSHRQLTFQARRLLLELDVLEGDRLQVTCQVVPAQRATLTIRHRSGHLDLGEDRHGLFHVPRLPDGPVSLRCVPLAAGAEPIATSWLALRPS